MESIEQRKRRRSGRPKKEPEDKFVKITLTAPPDFWSKIDSAARIMGETRSSFIRNSAVERARFIALSRGEAQNEN